MKKLILLGIIIGMLINKYSIFGQATSESQNNSQSNSESSTNLEGISFNLPQGNWSFLQKQDWLVPLLQNATVHSLETDKKIVVAFGNSSRTNVLSILDAGISNLSLKFRDLKRVTQSELITNNIHYDTALYRSIYEGELLNPYSSISVKGEQFTIEVIAATDFKKQSNVGILYIITPTSKYFENRFAIGEIRKALKVKSIPKYDPEISPSKQ